MFEASHIIKLTVVLYKVSDFFPVKEPLKFLIRKKADEILTGLILLENDPRTISTGEGARQMLCDIEVLKAYFQVAETQHWVKEGNFEVLEKEYEDISQKIKSFLILEKKPCLIKDEPKAQKSEKLENEKLDLSKKRCGRIIEILKERKTVQVKDLKDVFPTVSKRTLRRDFEYLLQKGFVERIGDSNNTLYQLIKR